MIDLDSVSNRLGLIVWRMSRKSARVRWARTKLLRLRRRLNDARWWLIYRWQTLRRGYHDGEIGDLDHYFLEWIVPRLKAFRNASIGLCGMDDAERKQILNVLQPMIDGFEAALLDEEEYVETNEDGEEAWQWKAKNPYREARKLFAEHLPSLWT